MNKMEPWTLEPWHITASFRKSGFIVPEHAIEMPPAQIKGPDLSLQDKEFYVTVTVSMQLLQIDCFSGKPHNPDCGIPREAARKS